MSKIPGEDYGIPMNKVIVDGPIPESIKPKRKPRAKKVILATGTPGQGVMSALGYTNLTAEVIAKFPNWETPIAEIICDPIYNQTLYKKIQETLLMKIPEGKKENPAIYNPLRKYRNALPEMKLEYVRILNKVSSCPSSERRTISEYCEAACILVIAHYEDIKKKYDEIIKKNSSATKVKPHEKERTKTKD